MLPFSIEAIDEPALRSLVDNQIAERRDLEYKRDLPGKTDDDVKEFLADVTSLANAQGGDLIFGMEEAEGVAADLVGIECVDPDGEILRLESSLRANVAPRLIGLQTHWVALSNGRGAIVLRVPASMSAPHQIVFKRTRRFWGRSSKGKYEMDVHELRHAFTQSEQLPQRFLQLHEQAIAMAQGSNMPFAVGGGPIAIISVAPLGLFREEQSFPIQRDQAVVPFRSGGYNGTDMIEGVLLHGAPERDKREVFSSALTHRSGRVDCAFVIGGVRADSHGSNRRLVWPSIFEEGLLEMARSSQTRLQPFGIDGPWVVLATVLGVKGFVVIEDSFYTSEPAFRDRALLGQIVLDRIDGDGLLPIAENFWLLFGRQRPDGALGARR